MPSEVVYAVALDDVFAREAEDTDVPPGAVRWWIEQPPAEKSVRGAATFISKYTGVPPERYEALLRRHLARDKDVLANLAPTQDPPVFFDDDLGDEPKSMRPWIPLFVFVRAAVYAIAVILAICATVIMMLYAMDTDTLLINAVRYAGTAINEEAAKAQAALGPHQHLWSSTPPPSPPLLA